MKGSIMATREELDARRAARRASRAQAQKEQELIDLAAIDDLEVEHGDENIAVLLVPFTPGSVTRAAVRTATTPEIKRYRSKVRPRKVDGELGDTAEAAEQLGRVCTVYPSDEAVRKALFEARPALMAQLGIAALELAQGQAVSEGKE
jgi:hypothetical protein